MPFQRLVNILVSKLLFPAARTERQRGEVLHPLSRFIALLETITARTTFNKPSMTSIGESPCIVHMIYQVLKVFHPDRIQDAICGWH